MPRRPEVTVHRSRFWATNTTIVAASAGCLLVDPGVYSDELRATARMLADPVLAAVHTHAHWDHVLWAPELGDAVPRFVTRGTRTGLDRDLPALRRHLDLLATDPGTGREEGVDADEPWDTDLVGLGRALPDGEAVPWSGPEAVLFETGGHVAGHGSAKWSLPSTGSVAYCCSWNTPTRASSPSRPRSTGDRTTGRSSRWGFAGGCSPALGIKNAAAAAIYGGAPGSVDPCYHLSCDDIDNLSLAALDQMSDAAAHATISLAQSTEAINGKRGKGNFNVKELTPPAPLLSTSQQ